MKNNSIGQNLSTNNPDQNKSGLTKDDILLDLIRKGTEKYPLSSIIGVCGKITPEFLVENNFPIEEFYSEGEITFIFQRLRVILAFRNLCSKYNLECDKIIIRNLEGIDYVNFNDSIKDYKMPVDIFLLETFGGPFLELPYSFKEKGKVYFNYDTINVLFNSNKPLFIPCKERKDKGFKTYIMFDKSTNLYKIGRSINIQFREDTLAGKIPLIITILYNNDDLEIILHREYKTKRIRGEWFRLSADDVLDIINRYHFKKWNNKTQSK